MAERRKSRAIYVCQECGQESVKWQGRCPECQAWNSFSEQVVRAQAATTAVAIGSASAPVEVAAISGEDNPRLVLDMFEFDRVLGGGIVPGSLVLIGGDPGIGKCLAGSTRVLDPLSGRFTPITEWATREGTVLSLDADSYRLAPRPAVAFHDQGVQPVIEITTQLGRALRCTSSHPVLTAEGWKPVGELKPGTRIASPRVLPHFGQDHMDECSVRLIAYALSDGSSTSQTTVTATLPEIEADLVDLAGRFGVELRSYPKPRTRARQYRFVQPLGRRAEARREVAAALKRVRTRTGMSWASWARSAAVTYGMLNVWRRGECVPSAIELARLANAAGVSLTDLAPMAREQAEMRTTVARLLESTGIRYSKAATKSIPECIFRLPRAQITLFLSVLFSCDGSVYINRRAVPGISYSTISRRLAEDVQHLLLRFGFTTRLRTKLSKVGGRPYTAYEIQLLGVAQVKRFLAEIGIWGRDEAKDRIATLPEPRLASTHADTVPTGLGFWTHLREATGGASFARVSAAAETMVHDRRHCRPLPRRTVAALARAYPSPFMSRLAESDIYWDEIQSIRAAGDERVYDLSVSNGDNFVANDLIVHNSTLLLQVAARIAGEKRRVLYVSGEESAHQLKLRARRLGVAGHGLYLLTETNLESGLQAAEQLQPDLLVVDSIQTVYTSGIPNAPGSVAQLRECTLQLMRWAKERNVPTVIVGHVTKEGEIAGPRLLEHLVDVVLYLEGERFSSYRLLRGVKNRFGAVSEVGVFEMGGRGLEGVINPSEVFLAERANGAVGSAIVPTVEGSRPLLIEIQALTSPSGNPMPRRTAQGMEFSRLLLLTAVLTKRIGLALGNQDVLVNVVGGLRVQEPAADLGTALAIASSFRDQTIPGDLVALGEVGLSGELRSCAHLDRRLAEAAKLGFRSCILPRTSLRRGRPEADLELIPAESLGEAIRLVLGRTRD